MHITIAGEVKSYPEIAAFTLGPSFSSLVHTATAVSCLGGCVGSLIFLGNTTVILFFYLKTSFFFAFELINRLL